MTTIPTLIIAPAILAAGLTYRYTGGKDEGSERARRRSEISLSGSNPSEFDISRKLQAGSRFKEDFEPGVPISQHRADAFVPTSQLKPQNTNDSPSVSHRRATSDSTHSPWKQILESNIKSNTEYNSTYPNTTDDIQKSSWMYRAAHKITGDLGPIEHQENYLDKAFDEGGQREATVLVPTWDKGVFRQTMFSGSRPKEQGTANIHAASRAAEEVTDKGVRGTRDAQDAAYEAIDRNEKAKAADAADKGGSGWWFWNKQQDTGDTQGRRASDVISGDVRKSADDARNWLWNKKEDSEDAVSDAAGDVKRRASDASDSARRAADDTRGWFWNKERDAEDTVSGAARDAKNRSREIKDDVRGAAEDTRGWFWNKKQNAEDAVSDAASDIQRGASDASDSVKRRASDASDTVRQAADDTRGWFWNKKQDAEDTASKAASDIQRRASDASDTVKRAAEDTGDWLQDKKQDASEAMSGAARSVKDKSLDARNKVQDAAEDTRDWLSNKQQDASQAASDAADTARRTASNASATVWQKADDLAAGTKDTIHDTRRSVGQAVDSTRDWASDKKGDLDQSINDAADSSRQWLHDKKNQANQSVADTAESVRDSAQARVDNRSFAQTGKMRQGDGNWDAKVRRDSMMSGGNTVLDALDDKFNEARQALRDTSYELKHMASDASVRASEKLRSAADIARPMPTNEGLLVDESQSRYSTRYGGEERLRFVENNSGIPTLSSTAAVRD